MEGCEREREERCGDRAPRRGLYAGAALAGTSRPRLLSGPPPISPQRPLNGLGPRGKGSDWSQGAGIRDTGAECGQGWNQILETALRRVREGLSE